MFLKTLGGNEDVPTATGKNTVFCPTEKLYLPPRKGCHQISVL